MASQVREQILKEHQTIRGLIAQIGFDIEELEKVKNSETGTLKESVLHLLDFLDKHMALENEVLAPILQTIDPWGPERAALLIKDHDSQKIKMTALREKLLAIKIATHELISLAYEFSRWLMQDLDTEERELLSADLLRDNTVLDDVFTG